MPRLSLEITFGNRTAHIQGLIDTGSPISVLPYSVGAALGAVWDEQKTLGTLAGALVDVESRVLAVSGKSPSIDGAIDIPLLFAWAGTDAAPVLFGQTNFLMEFNVCFYRSQGFFDVWRT